MTDQGTPAVFQTGHNFAPQEVSNIAIGSPARACPLDASPSPSVLVSGSELHPGSDPIQGPQP